MKRYVVTFRGFFTLVWAESILDAKERALLCGDFEDYGATKDNLDEMEAVCDTILGEEES